MTETVVITLIAIFAVGCMIVSYGGLKALWRDFWGQ